MVTSFSFLSNWNMYKSICFWSSLASTLVLALYVEIQSGRE
jgi:hypothetical protein